MRLLFEGSSYFFELTQDAATIRGAASIRINIIVVHHIPRDHESKTEEVSEVVSNSYEFLLHNNTMRSLYIGSIRCPEEK